MRVNSADFPCHCISVASRHESSVLNETSTTDHCGIFEALSFSAEDSEQAKATAMSALDDRDANDAHHLHALDAATSDETIQTLTDKHSGTRMGHSPPQAPSPLHVGDQPPSMHNDGVPHAFDETERRVVVPQMTVESERTDDGRGMEALMGGSTDPLDSFLRPQDSREDDWSYSPVHSPDRFRDQDYYSRMQRLTEAARAIDAVRSTGAFSHSDQGEHLQSNFEPYRLTPFDYIKSL